MDQIQDKNPFIKMGPELQKKIIKYDVLKELADQLDKEIQEIYRTCTHTFAEGTPSYRMVKETKVCLICNHIILREDFGEDNG